MYFPGQIIYDRDTKRAVQIQDILDIQNYPKRHTHFIRSSGEFNRKYAFMEIALPKSITEAEEDLEKGLIVPAPVPPTHHWKCGDWLSNCRCS